MSRTCQKTNKSQTTWCFFPPRPGFQTMHPLLEAQFKSFDRGTKSHKHMVSLDPIAKIRQSSEGWGLKVHSWGCHNIMLLLLYKRFTRVVLSGFYVVLWWFWNGSKWDHSGFWMDPSRVWRVSDFCFRATLSSPNVSLVLIHGAELWLLLMAFAAISSAL